MQMNRKFKIQKPYAFRIFTSSNVIRLFKFWVKSLDLKAL